MGEPYAVVTGDLAHAPDDRTDVAGRAAQRLDQRVGQIFSFPSRARERHPVAQPVLFFGS